MKNLSLQDQLLKAGLTNDHKVKQVRSEKRKQNKKRNKNNVQVVNEAQNLAQETKAKQVEKDKELNQQRNQQAEEKQIANQILQLIELNKLPKDNDDAVAYNFNDQNKVKTLYISEEIRNKIISGRLAVVKAKASYEVVVVEVANKIKQRNEQAIIVLFDEQTDTAEDDEYQGYEIPDDLMW